MKYSFSIDSFDKYWRRTDENVQIFLKDSLNEELAIICAQNIWHLCDWYFKENEADLGFKQLSDLQGDFGARCSALRAMRDICNGHKHASIEKTNTPVIRRTHRHTGAFSSGFSRTFDISVLEVELVDGSRIYFDDAVREAFKFWKNIVQSK